MKPNPMYKTILENMKELVYVRDMDMNILYINPAAERLTGWSLQEVLGKKCYEVFGDKGRGCKDACPANRAISERLHVYHYEGKIKTRSGDVGDMKASISPFFKGKEEKGAVVVMEDISQLREIEDSNIVLRQEIEKRKRVEEKLRKSEEFARATLNATSDLVHLIDTNGNILNINNTAAQRLGKNANELIGENLFGFFPSDVAKFRKGQVEKATRSGKPLRFEEQSEGRFFRTSIYPTFDTDGSIDRLAIFVGEITERKRAERALRDSEEKYRLLTENAKDLIYRMSLPDGRYEYLSPASTHLLGYTPEELYETPEVFKNIIHPDWVGYFGVQWENLINGKMPSFYEYPIIHKSGETRWLHQRNVLISDAEGQPQAIEGVVTDITERKLLEDALKKSYNELENKVKERTTDLTETNIALKVLLKQRGKDKQELEESILSNIKLILTPILEKLKKSSLKADQIAHVNALESHINDLTVQFTREISSAHLGLTPTQIRIASLIKEGKTTKEIAALLFLSANTILTHRYKIRTKLGLKNKKTNLRAYLQSLMK